MEYIKSKLYFNKLDDYSQVYNIAVCTDNNVVRAMGVLLFSILENNSGLFAFHIFYKGTMNEEDKKRI